MWRGWPLRDHTTQHKKTHNTQPRRTTSPLPSPPPPPLTMTSAPITAYFDDNDDHDYDVDINDVDWEVEAWDIQQRGAALP